MPPPHPEHLFEQANALIRGAARETDLRRAISNAYYALFHFVLTAAADMVVGADQRATARYSFVYRSVEHSQLRAVCSQVRATAPQNVALCPTGGFGGIADFARITLNLQELRNQADYDPSKEFSSSDAEIEVSNARQAIKWFQEGSLEQQQAFLTMVLFKSRSSQQRTQALSTPRGNPPAGP